MNLVVIKLLDKFLRFFGRERIPIKGSIFQLIVKKPELRSGFSYSYISPPQLISLREFPEELSPANNTRTCKLIYTCNYTLFVLDVYPTNSPIWEEWVKVLFASDQDNLIVGWIPFSEFCHLVRPLEVEQPTTP